MSERFVTKAYFLSHLQVTTATKDWVIITETTNQSAALGSSIRSDPPSQGMTPTPVAPPPMVNVTNSVKPEPVNLLNQQGK